MESEPGAVSAGAAGPARLSVAVLLRLAGVALVLLLGAVFVYANRSEVPAATRAVREANLVLIAAAAGLSLLFLLNLGAFHLATYRAVGLHLGFWRMLELTTASNFVNMVAKSGGFGGLALFLQDAGRRGQPRGKVITSYFLASLLGHVAFGGVLLLTLVIVWIDGRLTRVEVIGSLIFAGYQGFYTAVLIAGARSRTALRFIHEFPSLAAHRAAALIGRRGPPREPDHEAADDLYEAIQLLFARPRSMLIPGFHAVMVEVLGVLTIWTVLWAFDQHVGLQVPFVAYAISVLFSIIGVLPAGIGFAEASLGAVFASFDVPGPAAAVVVITYRLFEVWVPFAIGAWAAQSLARRRAPP